MNKDIALCVDYTEIFTDKIPQLRGIEFLHDTKLQEADLTDKNNFEMALAAISHMQLHPPVREASISRFFDSAGYNTQTLKNKWKPVQAIPYSPILKYEVNLVAHPTRSENIQLITGSPLEVLHYATLESTRRRTIEKEIIEKIMKGFHIIGIGTKEQFSMNLSRKNIPGLSLLGIVLFEYELQKDIHETLRTLELHNISLRIISNDSQHTCNAILKLSGLNIAEEYCVTGNEIQSMSDEELETILDSIKIFAELNPVDHRRLLRLFENNYEVLTSKKNLEQRLQHGIHAR